MADRFGLDSEGCFGSFKAGVQHFSFDPRSIATKLNGPQLTTRTTNFGDSPLLSSSTKLMGAGGALAIEPGP